jgi:poly(A) polymerase
LPVRRCCYHQWFIHLPATVNVLSQKQQSDEHAPLIIPRSEHSVSRKNISKSALKVLYRLKESGYQAFLVGGSVRDLLLNRRPKDFDVATDASPEEVSSLFRNSRLIGRRFRLVHVRYGREIIEVATFRRSGQDDNDAGREVCETSGRILSDNAYGTIEDDAWRRDFTVNALYYNIADFSIWAFAGGMDDMQRRELRLIGEAQRRYREDPVRMLRAARFAAKLEFSVHDAAAVPIPGMARLIDDVPPARLFDEFLKMFQSGYAQASFRQLRTLGLFGHLFPVTEEFLTSQHAGRSLEMIERALANTDERVRNGKPITPMFLFAVFLWYPVERRMREIMAESADISAAQALITAADEISQRQGQRIALPRRFSFPMREMLQLQPRFLKKTGRRAMNLMEHRRFRAAYDLLLLRAEVGDVDVEIAEFWTRVQELSIEEQQRLFGLGDGRKRRSGRPKRPAQSP